VDAVEAVGEVLALALAMEEEQERTFLKILMIWLM
jgi:hypothetical protein